jgi:hypothetical protein
MKLLFWFQNDVSVSCDKYNPHNMQVTMPILRDIYRHMPVLPLADLASVLGSACVMVALD